MDAHDPVDPHFLLHLPAYRACLADAVRDLQGSCAAGRPITLPNLRRLFERRWARAICGLPQDEREFVGAAGRQHSRSQLTACYRLHGPGPQ